MNNKYDLKATIDATLSKEETDAPLVYHVRFNNLEKVKLLLKNGADVNKKGSDFRNPLALAFALQNLKMAEVLLEAGANPNLLCGRNSLSFMAINYPKHYTQEKSWLYNKQSYDLLKKFNTDFNMIHDLSKQTLEEAFQEALPSVEFINKFK